MTWKLGSSHSNDSESLAQVTKLRLQNIKYKVQIENIKKQMQPLSEQNNRLLLEISEFKNREDHIKSHIIKLSSIIDSTGLSKVNKLEQILDIFQKKLIQNKQNLNSLEKQLKNVNEKDQTSYYKIAQKEKDIQIYLQKLQQKQQEIRQLSNKINLFISQIQKTKHEREKKDSLLGQLSHKLSQLEIQKKDIEEQLNSMRINNHQFQANKIKKECQQFLGQIAVKDDDYLKSYLLKNYRHQNGNNSVSRKNKYDFIFQN